jgi:DNA (cytosine-5)-methyltransferase 1
MGWKPSFFSEIDAFPCAVLQHHYPEVPLHGDFTTIQDGDYEPINLLVGGTPCQSFSVAGLRKGLDDPRGNLMLGFGALAKRLRPTWLVWENVPGVLPANGGRDFGTFLGMLAELGYGFAYRVLDAQFFGVAQRRKRVFVVGYLGDWRPAAAVLFERDSLSGNPAPSREAGKSFTYDVAPSLTASGRGVERAGETRGQDPVVACHDQAKDVAETLQTTCSDYSEVRLEGGDGSLAGALSTGGGKPGQGRPTICIQNATRGKGQNGIGIRFDDQAYTLDTASQHAVQQSMAVRRLTPVECERLQGFPDNFTQIPYRNKTADKCPDGPRYKALGNSMAVPCMKWIGERIQQVQEITQNNKVKKKVRL